ncbi:GNAT family N-acetyltransferase [Nocardioides hungaricus]
MSNWTVRKATAADVDALVRLRAEMFAAMNVADTEELWRTNAHRWFSDRIEESDYCFVVVEVDGQVVSCAAGAIRDAAPSPAVPDGRDILVSNVSTAPAYRGRGYGRAAFDGVMAWARQAGVRRAELMATAFGRGMYLRAGFHDTSFPAMRAALGEA